MKSKSGKTKVYLSFLFPDKFSNNFTEVFKLESANIQFKSKFDKRESIKQKEWRKEKAKNLKLNSKF